VIVIEFILKTSTQIVLTSIVVTKETRDRLKYLGKKGETYDHILRRLLSEDDCNE